MLDGRSPEVTAPELGGKADEGLYQQRWSKWRGRERDNFVRCAAIAQALSWEEALALSGAAGRVLSLQAVEAYRKLASPQPVLVPLRTGKFTVRSASAAAAQLVTYRNFDPLEIPSRLLPALGRFDGRDTAAVVAEVASADGFALDAEILRLLVDFEVLVPA